MDNRPKISRTLVVWFCLALAGVAVVAVTLFGVPLRSLFLYGAIAACPLMHLFMAHGAHEHDGGEASQKAGRSAPSASENP
jgi:high-affinity Fe2+/Pb2+ permease